MPIVLLGNNAVRYKDDVLDGQYVTRIVVPDDDPHSHRMRNITHTDGLWPQMSAAPPAWVECDDAELESALAEHFGCPIGRPAAAPATQPAPAPAPAPAPQPVPAASQPASQPTPTPQPTAQAVSPPAASTPQPTAGGTAPKGEQP